MINNVLLMDPKLIITVALKKELPLDWLKKNHFLIVTLESLKSGILSKNYTDQVRKGVLFIITGVGKEKSIETSYWILKNLSPLFVVNIGSAGSPIKKNIRKWIIPKSYNYLSEKLENHNQHTPFYIKEFDPIFLNLRTSDFPVKNNNNFEAVDMESFHQMKIFSKHNIPFYCLKFMTDFADKNTQTDFTSNIKVMNPEIITLLSSFLYINEKNIDVIIPTYNRNNSIKQAINSVLNQSFKSKNIIIVDDASTDLTNVTINTLQKLESSPKIVTNITNMGVSKSRNLGIKATTSPWIAFLDSDDEWTKTKLKDQIDYLYHHPYSHINYTEEKWIRNGKHFNQHKHHKKKEGWIWKDCLDQCLLAPSSVLIHKEIIKTYGSFDESFAACEDYDLWIRLSRFLPISLCKSIGIIKHGGHSDQLSMKYPNMDLFRLKALIKQLKTEKSNVHAQKLNLKIKEKKEILIQGATKHNNLDLLNKLNSLFDT